MALIWSLRILNDAETGQKSIDSVDELAQKSTCFLLLRPVRVLTSTLRVLLVLLSIGALIYLGMFPPSWARLKYSHLTLVDSHSGINKHQYCIPVKTAFMLCLSGLDSYISHGW